MNCTCAVSAVDQLEVMANKKQYGDASKLLEASPALTSGSFAQQHTSQLQQPSLL